MFSVRPVGIDVATTAISITARRERERKDSADHGGAEHSIRKAHRCCSFFELSVAAE